MLNLKKNERKRNSIKVCCLLEKNLSDLNELSVLVFHHPIHQCFSLPRAEGAPGRAESLRSSRERMYGSTDLLILLV